MGSFQETSDCGADDWETDTDEMHDSERDSLKRNDAVENLERPEGQSRRA